MNIQIAQATEADGPACRALFRAAFRDFLDQLGRPLTPDAYDWLLPAVAEGRVLLATLRGKRCGAAVYYDQGDARVIEQIGISPDHQGKGIGSVLLRHLEAAARGDGKRRLTLITPEMMTHLVAFYRNHGFAVDHIGPADHGLDPHPRAFLSKSLEPHRP